MIAYAFLFYLIALTSCIGAGYVMWGTVFQRLSPDELLCTRPSSMELGVVGFFTMSVLAVLVNFVAPVSQMLSASVVGVFLLAGVVNLIKAPKPGLFKLLVIASVFTLFSFWGTKFLLSYDAGLYHLPAISWMKDEPIVFGLANLYYPFGFNSLMFAAFAIFWLPVFEVEGLLLANYLPAILTIIILLNHLFKPPTPHSTSMNASTLFGLFCIVSFAAMPALIFSNTTSTDLAPNMFTLLSAFMFLRAIEESEVSTDEVFKNHIILWTVATFAILTKLSAVIPGLLAVLYSLRYSNILGTIIIRRTAYFLAGTIAIWLLRNFILSGCLIFPLGFTCADTSNIQWSVGAESTISTQAKIEWWAKAPREVIPLDGSSPQWFEKWLKTPDRGGQLAKIGLAMVGFPIVVLLYLLYLSAKRRKESIEHDAFVNSPAVGLAWVVLAAVIGLLFGFFTAPDPRFWWGSLITLMIMLPVTALTAVYYRHRTLFNSRSAFLILLCSFFLLGRYLLFFEPPFTSIIFPVENHSVVIPYIQTRSVQAPNFVVNIPIHGDRCWLAPKPCAPVSPQGLNTDHFGRYLVFSIINDTQP